MVVIDLIERGYAGFDNITVASSDQRGDVTVPGATESDSGGVADSIALALCALLAAGLPRACSRVL